jgi:hypothetical protein
MRALPETLNAVSDPRRAQGRRHPIRAVLAIGRGRRLMRYARLQGKPWAH